MPDVHAIARKQIEGVQERAGGMLTRMQPLEVRNAIIAANDRLAIHQESTDTQPASGMDDPWIGLRPIKSPPCE